MKKKSIVGIIAICAVIVMTALTIGVNAMSGNNLFELIKNIGNDSVSDGTLLKELSTTTDMLVDKAITKVYSPEELFLLRIASNGEIDEHSNLALRDLYSVNRFFPVECLREVNDNLVYAIYKVKETDGLTYNMYLFFEKVNPAYDVLETSENAKKSDRELEQWALTGRVLFASGKLSIKDFANIKVGSSYNDVNKIDDMTAKFRPEDSEAAEMERYDEKLGKYVNDIFTPEPILQYKSYHYLTDGIICINFERADADSEFVVTSIGFNESFELPSIVSKGAIEMKISKEDYPAK